jgi:formamidopyrimidine-DNA glycosylase
MHVSFCKTLLSQKFFRARARYIVLTLINKILYNHVSSSGVLELSTPRICVEEHDKIHKFLKNEAEYEEEFNKMPRFGQPSITAKGELRFNYQY